MKVGTIMRGTTSKKATVDFVMIALFASLGLATKNIIHPLVATLAGSLYIPTGALAGGFYMMWPVLSYGFVGKTGTATVTSLTQALISLILPFGNFGVLSFVIYLAPGIAIDCFLLLIRHRACCAACCMGATAVANIVGTVLVGSLILALPEFALLFIALIATASGCLGGLLANMILVRVRKIGLKGERIIN